MNTIFLYYFAITLLVITNSVIDARCICSETPWGLLCLDEKGRPCDDY